MNTNKTLQEIRDEMNKPKRVLDPLIMKQVTEEFNALMLGRDQLTMEELYNYRRYARRKTKMDQNEDNLTDEQSLWKVYYQVFDSQISKIMDKQAKEALDLNESDYDNLVLFKKISTNFITTSTEVNDLLDKQINCFEMHFDNSGYKKKIDKLTELMLDKTQSNKDHLKLAKQILELSDSHKKQILGPLVKITADLQDKLFDLEEQEMIFNVMPATKDLLNCFKEIFFNNQIIINYIRNNIELDNLIPKGVLENDGNIDIPFPASIAENMKTSTELYKQACERHKELDEKRKRLFKENVSGKKIK